MVFETFLKQRTDVHNKNSKSHFIQIKHNFVSFLPKVDIKTTHVCVGCNLQNDA